MFLSSAFQYAAEHVADPDRKKVLRYLLSALSGLRLSLPEWEHGGYLHMVEKDLARLREVIKGPEPPDPPASYLDRVSHISAFCDQFLEGRTDEDCEALIGVILGGIAAARFATVEDLVFALAWAADHRPDAGGYIDEVIASVYEGPRQEDEFLGETQVDGDELARSEPDDQVPDPEPMDPSEPGRALMGAIDGKAAKAKAAKAAKAKAAKAKAAKAAANKGRK